VGAWAGAGQCEEGGGAEPLGVREIEAVIGRQIIIEPYPRIQPIEGEIAGGVGTLCLRQGTIVSDMVLDPVPTSRCREYETVLLQQQALRDLDSVLDEQADGVLFVGHLCAQGAERTGTGRVLARLSRRRDAGC